MNDYIFLLEDLAEDTEEWFLIKNCSSEEDARNKFISKFLPYKKLKYTELIQAFDTLEIKIRMYCKNEIKEL